MTSRWRNVSLRTLRITGIMMMFVILFVVIVTAYQVNRQASSTMRTTLQQQASVGDALLRVNELLRSADLAFNIYIRRDRVVADDVLTNFRALESSLADLPGSSGITAEDVASLSDTIRGAKIAFLNYHAEERIDPAADSAIAYLGMANNLLQSARSKLLHYASPVDDAVEDASTGRLASVARLLNTVEIELHRYVNRERVKLNEVLAPVRLSIDLLKFVEQSDVTLPDSVTDDLARLYNALTNYEVALHNYAEEERVTYQRSVYADFENLVTESWGNSVLALALANRDYRSHVLGAQSQTVQTADRGGQILLVLFALGFVLTIAMSYVIGRGLSGRLKQMVVGTRRIAKGNFSHRLISSSKDEFGQLTHAFNSMATSLQRKEREAQDHLKQLDEANTEIREANLALEQRVRLRTEELERALSQARKADHAKSEFLAKVSHEIRTPMNGVLGMTELLLGTELNVKQHRFATGLHESALNLLYIINDILDFSKIEAGRMEMDARPFDLLAVADASVEMLTEAAHRKQLKLVQYIAPEVPIDLQGDAIRLRQVLLNLLDNAVKFTEAGEVIVSIELAKRATDEATLKFEVTDSGPGIPVGARETLFEAFSQVSSLSNRKYPGTGLGLAISRQLVQLMGGEISFSSTEREGSTFGFTARFPVLSEETAACRLRIDELRHSRVLLVYGHRASRRVLHRMLADVGCECDIFDSPHEAMSAMPGDGKAPTWDFAIVDAELAGLGADNFIDAINRRCGPSPPKVLLCDSTGSVSNHDFDCTCRPLRQKSLYEILKIAASGRPEQVPVDPDPRPASHFSNARVLVAEDNLVSQEVVRSMLERFGCRVSVASDGLEAVNSFQNEVFDLVLLDCQMPELDGHEVARVVREYEGTDIHTPLVAVTASATSRDRQRCLASGMDDYLAKPITEKMLAQVLVQWCGQCQESPPARPDELASAMTAEIIKEPH